MSTTIDGVTKAFNRDAEEGYFHDSGHLCLSLNFAAYYPYDEVPVAQLLGKLESGSYVWSVDPLTGVIKVAGKVVDLERAYAALRKGIEEDLGTLEDGWDGEEWQKADPAYFKEFWAEFVEEQKEVTA